MNQAPEDEIAGTVRDTDQEAADALLPEDEETNAESPIRK